MLTNFHDKIYYSMFICKIQVYNSRMILGFYINVHIVFALSEKVQIFILCIFDIMIVEMVLCLNQNQCRNSFSHVCVPFIMNAQKSILFCDNPFRDKGVMGNVIYMPTSPFLLRVFVV